MTGSFQVPLAPGPLRGSVRPPGSKSATIRALAAAAMAVGRSHLYGALVSDDTLAMAEALRSFGVAVDTGGEPWVVDGTGGRLKAPERPIDAVQSGLTARIALAMAAFAEGTTTVDGDDQLRRRPVDALVDSMTAQGVTVHTTDGGLPASVTGQGGLWGSGITVDCSKSSQFATAMLLVSPLMTEPAELRLEGLEGSAGYIEVTAEVMEAFGARVTRTITGYEISNDGYRPADYLVAPDASAAVYPMVAAAITGGQVMVEGLFLESTQPDIVVASRLADMGCSVSQGSAGVTVDARGEGLRAVRADMSAAPDGSLALAIACLFASGESKLSGLQSLRYKESNRLAVMVEEMTRLGGSVTPAEDSLVIRPRPLHGAVVDPHGDHRIAMSCALAGLVVEGVEVADPGVVSKTWPGYWDMLHALTTGL